jgi:GDP/UDP-N,N'-diacetylbacillosamine 2-epimerase (hydrolysing)
MKIGILTSSRADFGIYYPIVKQLSEDAEFDVEIIAFGTHLKKKFGETINEIKGYGFNVPHQIHTITENESAADIAKSIGDSTIRFAQFWSENKFDLVFALGDRYEMYAAVSAASPFNIDIAHLHGGETTLGAIDNAYRHAISLMSKYIFVSTEDYKKRAQQIIEDANNVFNVGALSIDNLLHQEFFTLNEFEDKFDIDLTKPSILSTFHPETVSLEKNETYITELISAFEALQESFQIIITMPNADTMGNMIREKLVEFGAENTNVKLIESFGMKGYLTCMKHCKLMVGNTSSGFVEAAFFPTWVINLGDRQAGRIITENIINSRVGSDSIVSAVKAIAYKEKPVNTNIYGSGNTASAIISHLKSIYGLK